MLTTTTCDETGEAEERCRTWCRNWRVEADVVLAERVTRSLHARVCIDHEAVGVALFERLG